MLTSPGRDSVALGYHGPDPTPDEIGFRAAAVADTNNNVLFTLGQLAKEFPELQPTLQASLEVREASPALPAPMAVGLSCWPVGLLACWPGGSAAAHVPRPAFLASHAAAAAICSCAALQEYGLRMPARPPSRAPGAV